MTTLTDKARDIIAYLDKNAPKVKPDGLPTVGELLAQSRAAHEIYRRALRHRANGVTVEGNPQAATEAVATAARLRAQAEVRDPHHDDPAWAEELATTKFPHNAMVEFYDEEVKYYVHPVEESKPADEDPKPDPKPEPKPASEHVKPDAETR